MQEGLISIVRVDVTNDLSYCTVYISAMQGLEPVSYTHLKINIVFIKKQVIDLLFFIQ